MRSASLLVVFLLGGAGCGGPRPRTLPMPSGPPAVLPRLVTDVSNHVQLDVRINDLPVTKFELVRLGDDYAMPALYFLRGANAIAIRYTADPSAYTEQPPSLIVKLSELAAEQPSYGPPTDKRVFAQLPTPFDACSQGHEGPACTQTAAFEIEGALPAWTWLTGETITDSPAVRAELLEAHRKLRDKLVSVHGGDVDALRDELTSQLVDQYTSARLDGKPSIPDLDELLSLARHPAARVDEHKHTHELSLMIFGGGKLARLEAGGIPLLWLQGGAHDAPSGTLSAFSISFDVWWRREAGRWIPAAVWRTQPMVELPTAR